MAVKIASGVAAEHNGLNDIAASLARDPERHRVIIAIVDVSKVTTDTDAGIPSPTVRIRHAEVICPESSRTARAIMQRAMEARTGDIDLPFPEAFDAMDDSGE